VSVFSTGRVINRARLITDKHIEHIAIHDFYKKENAKQEHAEPRIAILISPPQMRSPASRSAPPCKQGKRIEE